MTAEAAQRPKAPQPQPEHQEPKQQDPTLGSLSKRDYIAIMKRAFKETMDDNLPALAAALAYYAFLAIPSALLLAAGSFSLLAGPDAVNSIVDALSKVMPAQAVDLVSQSLTNLTKSNATGITILGLGALLAIWSLGGAMQNVMWALNIAYEREETRGFVRRRLTAWGMLFFALLGFALSFGLLVLGPALAGWIGNASGQEGLVNDLWWAAQWPILIGGLMFAFAGILYLGPNVDHPKFQFLTLGVGGFGAHLARRVRALRALRDLLRLVQQDLGDARRGRDHAHVALADRARAAAGRRDQRGGRAKPRAAQGRAGRGRSASPSKSQ